MDGYDIKESRKQRYALLRFLIVKQTHRQRKREIETYG